MQYVNSFADNRVAILWKIWKTGKVGNLERPEKNREKSGNL